LAPVSFSALSEEEFVDALLLALDEELEPGCAPPPFILRRARLSVLLVIDTSLFPDDDPPVVVDETVGATILEVTVEIDEVEDDDDDII